MTYTAEQKVELLLEAIGPDPGGQTPDFVYGLLWIAAIRRLCDKQGFLFLPVQNRALTPQ